MWTYEGIVTITYSQCKGYWLVRATQLVGWNVGQRHWGCENINLWKKIDGKKFKKSKNSDSLFANAISSIHLIELRNHKMHW